MGRLESVTLNTIFLMALDLSKHKEVVQQSTKEEILSMPSSSILQNNFLMVHFKTFHKCNSVKDSICKTDKLMTIVEKCTVWSMIK